MDRGDQNPSADSSLARLRLVLACILIFYPAWYFVAVIALPDARESVGGRLLVGAFAAAALAGSYLMTNVRKHLESWVLAAAVLLMAHVTWLSHLNQLSYVYVFGPFLAFFVLSMGFDSTRHLLIYLLTCIAMASLVSGDDTHISKFFYLSVLVTGAVCSLVTTQTRISHLRRIKRQKEELNASNQALQEALKVSKAFFANTSHELRTPLTLIMGHAETVRANSGISRETDNSLRIIEQSATDLLGHVNNILDLTKSEACGLTACPAHFDLAAMLATISDSWRVVLQRKGIALTVNVPPGLPVVLDFDKTERIVSNLMSNAVKFTQPGGDIAIMCKADDAQLAIKFIDSGPGIPDAEKERIFKPFFRLDDASHSIGGTGLGLSIVREFTRLHKGSVEVEDNPSGGSIFTLKLPRFLAAAAGPTQVKKIPIRMPQTVAPAQVADSASPFRVLFVEDNQDLLNFLWSTFKNEFSVRLARDGHEALAMIQEEAPDLIVSDIMMPKLDGLELFERIRLRTEYSTVPFVFLSAKEDQDLKLELVARGAQDFIAKPFRVTELRQKILSYMYIRMSMVTELEAKNRMIEAEKARVDDLCIKLKYALEEAEAASAAKTQFLANMSHEFRTPLSAICGFTDILRMSELSDEDADFVERIRRASEVLRRLVNDILLAAKLESDHFQIECEGFTTAGLIRDLEGVLRNTAPEKDIVRRFSAAGLPDSMVSDRVRIHQVVSNLIVNAVKFTDEGTIDVQVTYRRERDGAFLIFRIVDTGAGVADDELEKLFRPFHQTDTSNTRRHDGTGLGLYIARRLAEALGGDVWHEHNESGRGSIFSARFFVKESRTSLPRDLHGRMVMPFSQPVNRI